LLVHAELPGPIEEATAKLNDADWKQYPTYLASRPDSAEVEAIRLMIELARKYGCRVHIVHLSSAAALPDLRSARAEGLPITVETCPHYLHFCAEEVVRGDTLLKCAPPIRLRANRERLWDALEAGDIDLVATDHSPCPPNMKMNARGNFREAWGGIASLELGLLAVWTEAARRNIPITSVARWMSEQPAKLAGLDRRKGSLEVGKDADLVVFDPDARQIVDAKRLQHRHAVTPYEGEELRGAVRMTMLRGQKVFECGTFADPPKGLPCFRT